MYGGSRKLISLLISMAMLIMPVHLAYSSVSGACHSSGARAERQISPNYDHAAGPHILHLFQQTMAGDNPMVMGVYEGHTSDRFGDKACSPATSCITGCGSSSNCGGCDHGGGVAILSLIQVDAHYEPISISDPPLTRTGVFRFEELRPPVPRFS